MPKSDVTESPSLKLEFKLVAAPEEAEVGTMGSDECVSLCCGTGVTGNGWVCESEGETSTARTLLHVVDSTEYGHLGEGSHLGEGMNASQ